MSATQTRNDSQESTTNRPNLDHRGDVCLDIGLLHNCIGFVPDRGLEIFRVEGTRDEAFINTASGPQETKGNNGKPESPVESASGLPLIFEPEDVDRLFDTAGHDVGVPDKVDRRRNRYCRRRHAKEKLRPLGRTAGVRG